MPDASSSNPPDQWHFSKHFQRVLCPHLQSWADTSHFSCWTLSNLCLYSCARLATEQRVDHPSPPENYFRVPLSKLLVRLVKCTSVISAPKITTHLDWYLIRPRGRFLTQIEQSLGSGKCRRILISTWPIRLIVRVLLTLDVDLVVWIFFRFRTR